MGRQPHDHLYGLPLEEFTIARNRLAAELGRGGDKEAAADVKRLAKPSKTAWALNQLARRHPEGIEALLAAGQQVATAQQRALEGDAGDLRDATRTERSLVDRLADDALAILGDAGGLADRLRGTLLTAARGGEGGELLRRGRLVADLEPSGFGLEGLAAVEVRAPVENRVRREEAREAERLQRQAQRARDTARRLLEEAERAEQRARSARSEAEAASDAAAEADRRAVEASGRLEALDRE